MRDPAGKVVLELAKNIGRETNNVAEYYSLLAALDYATSQGITALRIRSDSELLVRQMQGRYKVKSADLKPLYERASKMARQLKYFAIEHVRRELNNDADALANVALDSAGVAKYDGRSAKIDPSPGDTSSEIPEHCQLARVPSPACRRAYLAASALASARAFSFPPSGLTSPKAPKLSSMYGSPHEE